MSGSILRISLVNSIYFSAASFIVIWIAGALYEFLEKTPGRLDQGIIIMIVLGLILIMFFLAMVNILIVEHEKTRLRLYQKLAGVGIFFLVSAVILSILGVLFWFPI
ncbi:MAG: hypothetical protein V1866_04320 [archaeon]